MTVLRCFITVFWTAARRDDENYERYDPKTRQSLLPAVPRNEPHTDTSTNCQWKQCGGGGRGAGTADPGRVPRGEKAEANDIKAVASSGDVRRTGSGFTLEGAHESHPAKPALLPVTGQVRGWASDKHIEKRFRAFSSFCFELCASDGNPQAFPCFSPLVGADPNRHPLPDALNSLNNPIAQPIAYPFIGHNRLPWGEGRSGYYTKRRWRFSRAVPFPVPPLLSLLSFCISLFFSFPFYCPLHRRCAEAHRLREKRRQAEGGAMKKSPSELALEAFFRADGGDVDELSPASQPSLEELLLPGSLGFGFVDRVSAPPLPVASWRFPFPSRSLLRPWTNPFAPSSSLFSSGNGNQSRTAFSVIWVVAEGSCSPGEATHGLTIWRPRTPISLQPSSLSHPCVVYDPFFTSSSWWYVFLCSCEPFCHCA